MAIGASEFTELVASTLENIEGDLVDQVLTKHPTLDVFKGNLKSDTGRKLVCNLEGAEDGDTAFSDSSGSFSTSVSPDIIGASEWDWADPLVSKVRLRHKDLEMNSGSKTQIVDLLKSHIEAAKKQHAKTIAQALHSVYSLAEGTVGGSLGNDYAGDAVTGNGPLAGQFDGFDKIVGTNVTDTANSVTAGGITAADADHFWNAVRLTLPADEVTSIRKAFRTMRNELHVATSNMHSVDVIIAGRSVFEEYEDELDDKVRYVFDGQQGPPGQGQFRAFYDQDVEVRLDPDAPANRAYFLDLSTWKFRHLNDNFMRVHEPQKIQGTLDHVTPIASILSVGVNERRANGVLIRDDT